MSGRMEREVFKWLRHMERMSGRVEREVFKWLGHVERMSEERLI